MIRLGAQVALASVVLVAAILFVGIGLGLAGEPCAGQILKSSYYGRESGNRTADGSFFDGSQFIAASRSLPFGARLRVSYRGRSVVVVVRDRGPALWTHRDLDLSRAAASAIGMIRVGVAVVCVQRL